MKGIYNASTNEVVEEATMKEPVAPTLPLISDEGLQFWIDLEVYEQHIASRKRYTCHPSCKGLWKDGDDLEEGKDFEFQQTDSCENNCDSDWCKTRGCQNPVNNDHDKFIAYPIQKEESEDELWDAVIGIVLHATANDCPNDLKTYFTIKRKPL